jgi:hypothetical protein
MCAICAYHRPMPAYGIGDDMTKFRKRSAVSIMEPEEDGSPAEVRSRRGGPPSLMNPAYAEFLARKAPRAVACGFTPRPMRSHMTGHWKRSAEICIERGRSAAFLNTGLGKTTIELEFAAQVAEHTGKPSLIFAPLAVGSQIKREADRFGYDACVIRDMDHVIAPIAICNYDLMHKIDPFAFGGVALDESGILKSFTGATSRGLIENFRDVPFRLAATATPAPNDHMELGQHAGFLGIMSSAEMLSRWFKNDTETASQTWRLKGHAISAFWDWVASWAIMVDTPEDLGFDGSAFVLPPYQLFRHKASGDARKPIGGLFAEDLSAINMHATKRHTAGSRAEAVAQLIDADPTEQWLIWCDTNYESEAIAAAVTGSKELRGDHSPEVKEAMLESFQRGALPYLVTKPSLAGHGLNFQSCARMVFAGRSFSYELWYQAVRRCWRYGQKRELQVHLIVAEGEAQIGRVIDRKAEGHAAMKEQMRLAQRRMNATATTTRVAYDPKFIGKVPLWMLSA